ncbi:MAG: ion transporter [Nitrospirota bacterium]
MRENDEAERQKLDEERNAVVSQLEEWLEVPMIVLGFLWLVLLVIDLLRGLSPFLALVNTIVWALFILDFAVEFMLAPRKGAYMKRNWITALSLTVPALRIIRIARALRVMKLLRGARGLRLLRFITSLNRGMRTLRRTMGRRGFGYVLLLTLIITVTGAAGMYSFEKGAPAEAGFKDYGTALWWTAMIMTTMGSQYWPATPEGKILCLLLAVYAFTVFGYVTAMLATFFVGLDREEEPPLEMREIEMLRQEITELRSMLRARAAPGERHEEG